MTALQEPARTHASELDLAARQLAAIERFNADRQVAEQAAGSAGASREMRMDAARRLAVIRRQHDALIAQSHLQLSQSGERPLTLLAPSRAVLAHRNAWFLDKVAAALGELGISVASRTQNGAEVIGAVVGEQPDLVLVEDGLEMMAAEDVVRAVRQYSPYSLVAAQVPYSDRMGALLDAGANTVFVRQIPPVDVASRMWELLGSPSA